MKAIHTPDSITIVNVPPRHGKTVHIGHYTSAWSLGTYPDRNVMVAGYSSSFAASSGRKARDILERYGPEIFNVRIRSDVRGADKWEVAGHGGSMMTAGVGGPFTGFGFHIGIIDDSVKNAEEAMSKTIRDKQWEWYLSTWLTRKEPGSCEFIIATRWHSDDLTGRILADAKATGRPLTHIRLPALAEEDDPLGRQPGEALWPERYPVERLEAMRRSLSFWWPALYQQRPVPMGGALFKSDWLMTRRFGWMGDAGPECDGYIIKESGEMIRRRNTFRFMIVDPSLGKNQNSDPAAIGIFALTLGRMPKLLPLYVHSSIMPVGLIIKKMVRLAREWRIEWAGTEANGFQELFCKDARQVMPCSVKEIQPKGKSKLARGIPAVNMAESGDIILPEGDSDWLMAFVSELCEWTGKDGDRDDRVDVLSYAAREWQTMKAAGKTLHVDQNESAKKWNRL